MHEELARPLVGICVPSALTLPLPTFLEKKEKRRRWCAAGQGMVFFFCPKQGIHFRASLVVLNSVHVLCSQNRIIKLKALSWTGSVVWEFFVLNRVRVSNCQRFTYTLVRTHVPPPPPPPPLGLNFRTITSSRFLLSATGGVKMTRSNRMKFRLPSAQGGAVSSSASLGYFK